MILSLPPRELSSQRTHVLLPLVKSLQSASKANQIMSFRIATNGPLPTTSSRGSPAPSGQAIPNGKPTAPFTEQRPAGSSAQIAAQTVSSKDPKAAAQAASDMRNVVRRKLTGYVGFANLPNQWHRKSVRKGFNFNVMVVGMIQNYNTLSECDLI